MLFWATAGPQKLEYGPGTIYAGFPSSQGFGVGTVIFQLSGFYYGPCTLLGLQWDMVYGPEFYGTCGPLPQGSLGLGGWA